ncbi:MAG: LLM class flavin-dependent oxidoreductase [Candidatus Rokubacteria bacterium]|nr:LLM class flavin-dependent oxidoreductase [Candidatus Rokubacteria bacterium]
MEVGLIPCKWNYREAIEEAALADELGFDSVWAVEHHGEPLVCPSPLVALGGYATRTSRVRIGSYVVVLPFHHPVQVAEAGALLDVMSNGRFVLGLGLGYRQEEFDLYGVPMRERVERLVEGVDIIKALWTTAEVTVKGRYHTVPRFTLYPRPVQRPRPPIWIGAAAEKAIRRAAVIGDAWVSSPAGDLAELSRGKAAYWDAVREAGLPEREREIVLSREVFVGATRQEALAIAAEAFLALYRETYIQWHPRFRGMKPEDVKFETFAERRFIVGDPAECAARILEFQREIGFRHLICRMHAPGIPLSAVKRSMELFAKEVAPAVRAAVPPGSGRA